MRLHRATLASLALTLIAVDGGSGYGGTQAAPTSATLNPLTINVVVSSAEVYPRTRSSAIGIGQFTFDPVTGAMTGNVTFTGLLLTFADIHVGLAGTNGPTVLGLVPTRTDPNTWSVPIGAMLTSDLLNALLAGALYVDAHSAIFPDGEIRGQLRPPGIDVAVADMIGANVVPPVTGSAAGFAGMTIEEASSTATVHIQTTGVDDATEAHVHSATSAQNASAPLYSLMKDPTAASHWFLENQPITQSDLAALAAGMLYVDVHTPKAAAGALRGPLSLITGVPPTSSVVKSAGAPLDPGMIASVRAWITAGPENN
jgi:hypothetical protein